MPADCSSSGLKRCISIYSLYLGHLLCIRHGKEGIHLDGFGVFGEVNNELRAAAQAIFLPSPASLGGQREAGSGWVVILVSHLGSPRWCGLSLKKNACA